MAALRQYKAELLALVRCCDAGVQDRVTEYRRQLAAIPAPRSPAFLFRAGLAYAAGACFSCGDTLPELKHGRCWRCALAWRLACRLPIDPRLADALDTAKVCA